MLLANDDSQIDFFFAISQIEITLNQNNQAGLHTGLKWRYLLKSCLSLRREQSFEIPASFFFSAAHNDSQFEGLKWKKLRRTDYF